MTEEVQQNMWDAVIETLTVKEALVMPKLRRLTLDGRVHNILTSTIRNQDGLVAMISSRCYLEPGPFSRGACRLKKLTFWNFGEKDTHPLEKSRMDRLLEMSSVGLVCNWYWGKLDWYKVDVEE